MNSRTHIFFASLLVVGQSLALNAVNVLDLANMQDINIKITELPPLKTENSLRLDLSDLGEQVGNAVRRSIEQGSDAFGNALNNDQLGADWERGMDGLAKNMSRGFDRFNQRASTSLFPRMSESYRQLVSTVCNTRTMLQIGLPIAGTIALIVTGYYGTRFLWKYAEQRMLNPKPKVLLPGAKIGRYDRWKRYWANYKSPAMIFTESIKKRLEEIVEKTKNIKKHIKAGKKATYDNLLLCGEPGTGKTLFATLLADLTDMDFAAITAGSLLQKDAGVKYLNELVEMAKNSRYGVIIFIDEADALFVDRNDLDPASEHYLVLNHLLALTGDGSNKFMLIAATNHAHVLDEAMGRRFQDRVEMPLPDAVTRKQIIELYKQTVLFNEQNNGIAFVQAVKKLLTAPIIDSYSCKNRRAFQCRN